MTVVGAEPLAALAGAATTPGAGPAPTVCDIGGGTTDVVSAQGAVTAAGGGELLTLAVAAALDAPREVGERVKRGASLRVASAYLVELEDGDRVFLPQPAAPEVVGHLCTDQGGPAPFDQHLTAALSPQEWRAARLFLKSRAIAANIARCLQVVTPSDVVLLCGGGALDDEAVRLVGEALRPRGVVVGRANVLGRYGPGFAVALGLVTLLAQREG